MEFFKWAAVIVFLVMSAEVIKYYLKTKHDKGSSDEKVDAQNERINKLEERIRTLEKIITDPSETLRREIDQLK
ncbi:MAG: hypothetical protein HWE27_12250 [Gammaproteobacteria bacterium]|nr:hypothetical protein [Gammaproteobacteria bacterium]